MHGSTVRSSRFRLRAGCWSQIMKRLVILPNVMALQIVGTVIESFSSDASPSAQQMAALVDQIKLFGAPAIFLDASDNPALAQQIAAETGVKVITDLHLESLTDGAPAATYIELMKYNVTTIIKAFQ